MMPGQAGQCIGGASLTEWISKQKLMVSLRLYLLRFHPTMFLPFFKWAVTTTDTLLVVQAIDFETFTASFSKGFMDQKVSHSMIQSSPVMQIRYKLEKIAREARYFCCQL